MHTGQREENEDFVNLEENQAESFNREWRERAYNGHHAQPALGGAYNSHPAYNHNHRGRNSPLQLTQHPHGNEATTSGVTIEELPGSDEEQEQGMPNVVPPPTTSRVSRLLPSIPRVRRNSPKEGGSRSSPKYSKRTKKN